MGVASGVRLLGLNRTTSRRGRRAGLEKQHCGDRLHVRDADWSSDQLLPTGSRAVQNVNTTASADRTLKSRSTATTVATTTTINESVHIHSRLVNKPDSRHDSSPYAINVIIGRHRVRNTNSKVVSAC